MCPESTRSILEVSDAVDAAADVRDMDAFLTGYAEDAVLSGSFYSGGPHTGREAIRAFWERQFSANIQYEIVGEKKVEGNKITLTARITSSNLAPPGVLPLEIVCVQIFHEGKIKSENCEYTPESGAKLKK